MKKTLLSVLLICLLAIQSNHSFGQCTVTANAIYLGNNYTDTVVICEGESALLSADINCTSPSYYDLIQFNDFNNQTIGNGWTTTLANPVFNNPCQCPFVGGQPPSACYNGVPGQAGPDSAFAWIGTTNSSERSLITQSYDFTPYLNSNSCKIKFWMMYGITSGDGACEDPDATDEGVHLQYSTNNGGSWTDFPGTSINPIGNLSPTPPFNTITPGSGGYWAPRSSTVQQLQSTLYFWNSYQNEIPPNALTNESRIRWAQLTNTSSGWDTWGIDNISIICTSDNINILWSNGVSINHNSVNPTTDTWYYVTVYDSSSSNPFATKDSIFVKVNIPQTPVISLQNEIILSNFQNGNQWYSVSNGLIPGEINSIFYPLIEDDYYVKVIDQYGCWSNNSNIIHYFGLGITNNSTNNEFFNLTPNPTTESINIHYNNTQTGKVKISIHNISGKEIIILMEDYQTKGNYNTKFSISDLIKGIYFITFNSKEYNLTQKLIIE